MNAQYLKAPLIGDAFIEYPSITKGRWFVDASLYGRTCELWVGRFHIIMDADPMLSRITTLGLIAAVLFAEPLIDISEAASWIMPPPY